MYKLSGSKNINLAGILKKGKNIYDDIPAVRRKRQAKKALKILKYTSFTIIAASLLLVIFFAVHVANIRLIYYGLTRGQDKLISATALLKNKNYKFAIHSAKTAENYFSGSLDIIEEYHSNFFIQKTSFFSAQFNDLFYLLGAGELLSRAVQLSADYSRAIDPARWQEDNFYTMSSKNKETTLKEIYGRGPELNGIRANIALSRLKLDNIKYIGILKFQIIREFIQNLSAKLTETEEFLEKAIPLADLIPKLLGYPNESSNLIVFEDSRELWPNGGKIKALGIFNIKNGEIKSLDSYSLNEFYRFAAHGQPIAKTSPLRRYQGLSRWRLTEANWVPDWPNTAGRIEFFINRHPICNNKNITGAIAINSDALYEIIELNGPITIDNIEYDKNNFIAIFDDNNGARLLGRLTRELFKNLFNKPMPEINSAVELISSNLGKKNIVLFFKDKEAQKVIKDYGWSGEFRDTNGDFLAIVDSNLGNIKNDHDISRKIEYKIEESINGYFGKLKLSYANSGDEHNYVNYFRVYVPKGSIIVERKTDSFIAIETTSELNKTVFSGYIVVLPNTIYNISLEYKLPNNIMRNFTNRYSLMLEKQPGNNTGQVVVDVNLINKVKSYKPTGFNVYRKNDRNVRWETNFKENKSFVVVTGN